jgi:hypothetical protein
MGKGRNDRGGGRGKQFSAPEEMVGKQNSKAGMMPSSDEESESEEEQVPVQRQNPNAGMMPPSDDSEEEEEEEEVDPDTLRLRKILSNFGVPDSSMGDLTAQLLRWKAGEPEKPAKEKKPARAPEPTRREREAMAAKGGAKEESSSDEEPDPAVQKKLEEVRKRREAQSKQRIAKDGWDRMKPMSADNKPPGMAWPPPDQKAPAELS